MFKDCHIKRQYARLTIIALTFLLILTSSTGVFAAAEPLTIQSLSDDIAEIAERVGPAVVNIDVVRYVQTSPFNFRDPIFEWY